MTNEQKAVKILKLIFDKTMPKDQFGFYTEEMLFQDVLKIISS